MDVGWDGRHEDKNTRKKLCSTRKIVSVGDGCFGVEKKKKTVEYLYIIYFSKEAAVFCEVLNKKTRYFLVENDRRD